MSRVVLMSLAALCLLTPGGARGSSPCYCQYRWTHPSYNDTKVPLNARVLFFDPTLKQGTITFTEDSGKAVPFDLQPVSGSLAVWAVPRSPLSPWTSYRISYNGNSGSGSFTTGGQADTVAPTLSKASVVGSRVSGACTFHYGAQVTASGTWL